MHIAKSDKPLEFYLLDILKVARTIADLEGSDTIEALHLGEALQYRFND